MLINLAQKDKYKKLLSSVSKLSLLFSDSDIPYINYRAVENIFCKSFDAENLSRSDTAFDAKIGTTGIGIKTFICNNNSSLEKVAEFNALSKDLSNLSIDNLAYKLAEYRNERIELANNLYGIQNSFYHIVARTNKKLILFNTDYDKISIDNIKNIKGTKAGITFEDNNNHYSFNKSKTTLFRRFIIPENAESFPVEILNDPYELLLSLNESTFSSQSLHNTNLDYVVLPLYGFREGAKYVFPKSGLNQWNAGGRARNYGEVYIPVPAQIHKQYPNFFPDRDHNFSLKIPTGDVFNAKLCQDNSKALMTNPNNLLSDWLLRKVFRLDEGELLTYDRMKILGFDSVIIYKLDNDLYSIDILKLDSYEDFINNTHQ